MPDDSDDEDEDGEHETRLKEWREESKKNKTFEDSRIRFYLFVMHDRIPDDIMTELKKNYSYSAK